MKIVFFSTKSYDKEYFEKANKEFDFIFIEANLDPITAVVIPDGAVVCCFVNDAINEQVIEVLKSKKVRLIALRCAGFNQVNLEAAAKAGIKVVRVPAYSPHAVAEHAVALLLALNRKTHKAYNRVREGNFSLERMTGFDVFGKTVGVIGTGKIGATFASIMLGFGCRVIAYDPFPNTELTEKGIEYYPLNELLAQSDILSLHCPLTPETHHLIDEKALEHIKPGAFLINTSRGALIDTPATIDALKSRRLGALGIDVYEQEEHLFFQDFSDVIIDDDIISRLMTFPNVLITAHQAFLTSEALEQIALTTLQNIRSFNQGLPLANEVTLNKN
ncbi:2-hydroxyacid dehydrogenase [uncultured Imperialibacter sp.]|uniref:2-hydroxyacid dehydrogenase n=1 Tax=uncultured Imperialibacter sp. TaxID=1672639 RepID=UPI0030D6F941|tara:strand:- start:21916 stop:22911 length:996 start_codon:yes stop_codon:yes gene_type:complete